MYYCVKLIVALQCHRSGSTLAQIIACCLTASIHCLNQCWLIPSVRSNNNPLTTISPKISLLSIIWSRRVDGTLTSEAPRSPPLSRSCPRTNPMVTIVALSSINMFVFRFVTIRPFWLPYSKFILDLEKLLVKVMAKVKLDGHTWGLEFNRYVFRFVAIGSFLTDI